MKHNIHLKQIRRLEVVSFAVQGLFVVLSAVYVAQWLSGCRQGSPHTGPNLTSRQAELLEQAEVAQLHRMTTPEPWPSPSVEVIP